METFQQKAAKKQEELSQVEEAANGGDSEGDKKNQRIQELTAEAEEQSSLKRELEAELKRVLVPHKTTERQLAHLQKQQKDAENQLKVVRQRLQEARDQILAQAGSAQSEEACRTALLKSTEEELAEARAKVNELREAVSVALRSYEELEPHVHDAKGNTERVGRQYDNVKSRIKELNASGDDSQAIFGQRVPKVCRLVSSAQQNGSVCPPYSFSHCFFSPLDRSRQEAAQVQGPRCWSDWGAHQGCRREGGICCSCRACDRRWNSRPIHCH